MSLTLFAAAATLAVANASEFFTGDGTAYTLGDTTSGNCNMMSSLGFATTDYAALNNEQWAGLQNCGRCAEVTCDDSRCADKTNSVVVQILDRCPECKHGDLDLSPSVFKTLTGSDPSRYTIKWKFVDCPVTGNVNYCLKGGSNNFWTAIQPTNVATGIKSLQINGKATKMLDGAYYYLLDGSGKASTDLTKVTVSMTDINGVAMKDTLNLSAGSCTKGAKQFPKAGKTGVPATNTTVPTAAPKPTPVPVTAAPKVPVTPAPVTQTDSPAVYTTEAPTVTTATPPQEQQTAAPVATTPTPVEQTATDAPATDAPVTTPAPVEQTETDAPATTGPISEDSSWVDVLDCDKKPEGSSNGDDVTQQNSSNAGDETQQQSSVGGENSAESPDAPATVAPIEQGSDSQTPYQQSSGDGNSEYPQQSGSTSVGGEAENPTQDANSVDASQSYEQNSAPGSENGSAEAPITQGSDDTLHGSDVAGSEDQNGPATDAPSSPGAAKDCPM
ncbi:hypothetical protein PF005_g14185 [Phytophthora fragariae]|nr:hypothetical protein PF005_g14185 [Phytophthora fragariae]KAE9220148.1 hypothetical protein PF004_g13417 [Phytophthora fragariae]KAE9290200.1 hypothetical protein PF001_g19700 [Phytophthora fragariae]